MINHTEQNSFIHQALELGFEHRDRVIQTDSGKTFEGVVRCSELELRNADQARLEAAVLRLATLGFVKQLFIGYIGDDGGVSYCLTEEGHALYSNRIELERLYPLPKKDAFFVIMSFSNDTDRRLSYRSIQRVCKDLNRECYRVDEIDENRRITDLILESIRVAPLIIADLTDQRPNVYYELGFAHALNKDVVQLCHKETPLHFDIQDYPTIIYEDAIDLEDRLTKRLARYARDAN